ncbi:hypothetical protein [Sinanaerobacter chloroacetimidivorans]|uniref:Uncharacterized protein n=1 Tax=Sinanaerobacter chloroacetimidivorans TaxID=2818044 RepID=A0A8J7VZE0_9FIRM|nr:hypothetical protein [Sinanaerobacter chloroacetimidivorans]MBR0597514.1 hypothetical protein [Sinanaerobacter chloroacetimidivorans]
MADILKITSPISVNNKVHNLPKQLPTDAVFDLTNPNLVVKNQPKAQNADEEGSRQTLLQNLNKEIFAPLMNSTRAQADSIRKLVLMAKLFETSSGIITESFLDKMFIRPQELLGELLAREKGETIFQGEFFDSLRMLAKMEGQPRVKEAVIAILKHFDCFVNQDSSLRSIVKQSQDLCGKLFKSDAEQLQQHITKLDMMIQLNKDNPKEIRAFLKNEFIPILGGLVRKYQSSEKIHSPVVAIIHHIVRYDKADSARLEEAIYQLGDELKPLTNLTDDDLAEMKQQLFELGREAREKGTREGAEKSFLGNFGVETEDTDLPSLLSKALDSAAPTKITGVAQNLLMYMLQNESPVMPLMHFIIPFRFLDENTYGEFFVDKDCKERKGEANEARNIFFTIQSDKYGNFEVDLLERDKKIDLDIRCPELLISDLKEIRARMKGIIEDQGYRLTSYQVEAYQESQSILQRFPKLAQRKVGFDVKI